MTVVDSAKKYVCDDRYRFRLFNVVGQEARRVSGLFQTDQFSVANHPSNDDFCNRVNAYEDAVADLCRVQALLAHWGSNSSADTLTLPLRRLSDGLDGGGGSTALLALRSYPVQLVLYAAGIAAVNVNRFGHLRSLLHTPLSDSGEQRMLVTALPGRLGRVADGFKVLPGLDRHYTPVSDRMFSVMQPLLDELLFLGSDYERAFDRFELLFVVEQIHQSGRGSSGGRFEWKTNPSPLLSLLEEIKHADDRWPPVGAGLCGGSIDKFKSATEILRSAINRSGRW